MKQKEEENKNYALVVKADSSDGNYATEVTKVSNNNLIKFRDTLSKIVKLPIGSSGFYWGTREVKGKDNDPRVIYKDKLTEEEIEWLEDYFPYGEYGIHSICSIKLVEILEEL